MPALTPYAAHARGLLAIGLPLVGSHVAQVGLHVTDTLMVGWYGVDELAALVLAGSFFFFLFILGSGYGIAVMGMVASSLGRGDEVQVRRETRMGLWLSILFGLVAMPVFLWSAPVLEALGQEPALSAMAQDYLRIAGWGMVPALVVMTLKSYLSALERTQVVLWVTVAGLAMNALLNWMLIFGNAGAPELGLRGAAIATAATQVASAGLLASYAAWLPAARRFRLFQRFWRPDWHAMGQVFRLGTPVGLTGLAESSLFIAAALMMGWVGTVELAAHGIALEIEAVTFMVHLGLSNAATVRIGRAHGERDAEAMRDVALTATALSLAVVAAVVVMFLAVPEAIIGLFVRPDEARVDAIVDFGVRLLAVAALFQVFDAMQVMALGFLRGVQDTRVPFWLAAVSYWLVGVPASYVLAFPLGLGGIGLWLGLVVGLAAAAVTLMWRFWAGAGRLAAAA
ncbi:MAG: MATE family efflux transporter [Rhodobacteraceae bacterium]|nr:MATE family efflux transporter [Paracoccaceae bacterium]